MLQVIAKKAFQRGLYLLFFSAADEASSRSSCLTIRSTDEDVGRNASPQTHKNCRIRVGFGILGQDYLDTMCSAWFLFGATTVSIVVRLCRLKRHGGAVS